MLKPIRECLRGSMCCLVHLHIQTSRSRYATEPRVLRYLIRSVSTAKLTLFPHLITTLCHCLIDREIPQMWWAWHTMIKYKAKTNKRGSAHRVIYYQLSCKFAENYSSLLCHCVPPQRKRLSFNQQKDNNTWNRKDTTSCVYWGREKKKLAYKR